MLTAGILELRFGSQWAFIHAPLSLFSFALAGLACLDIGSSDS